MYVTTYCILILETSNNSDPYVSLFCNVFMCPSPELFGQKFVTIKFVFKLSSTSLKYINFKEIKDFTSDDDGEA